MFDERDREAYSVQNYSGGEEHPAAYVPPEPTGGPGPGREKKTAPRFVALVAAVSLAMGAAGGGLTYWLLDSAEREAAPPAVVQEAPPAQAGNIVTTGLNNVSDIVQKVLPSVVEITTGTVYEHFFLGEYVTEGAGSGVIVSPDGYIVTNNHVVTDASDINVRTHDGSEYEAGLIGVDKKTDLAVIKIEASGLLPATFGNSDELLVGEPAVVIGNPLGTLGGTVTSGIISAKGREVTIEGQTMNLLQTSAPVNPGNSGGGLFNSAGNLVGIVNAKSSGLNVEGLGFAIPSNTAKEVVNELIKNGYVSGRPQLGIKVIEVADPITAARYRLNGLGIYVASVLVEGNGLQEGDRISSIEGQEIQTSADVTKALSGYKVGDILTVKVFRDGRETEVQVTLTEQRPEQQEPEEKSEI